MKQAAFLPAVLIVFLSSLACAVVAGPGPAEAVARSYFEAIRVKDFDKAMTMYSPDMWRYGNPKVTEKDWRQFLPKIESKLGDLQEYRLGQWRVNTFVGTGRPSGTYYTLTYEVTYSKYAANEVLTVFKPSGAADNDLQIVGHNINSPGLLQ